MMILKSRYNFIFILPILWMMAAPGGAQEVSMDAFSAEFLEKTGKTWESATPEEKRGFLSQYLKNTSRTLQEAQIQPSGSRSPSGKGSEDPSSNLKRTVNIEVRQKFFKKNGKSWDEATLEEQETFLTEYKAKKEKEAALQAEKKQKELRMVEKAELEKQKEKWALERKKEQEESARLKKEQDLQKKKEAEQRELEETWKKMEKMRRASERRRQQ